ncbi:MAG: GLPGLI family protein [Crocinitomicaceae bacterium]|nr:GLPGLI family protein [Crocinitomicaceae bacterium]
MKNLSLILALLSTVFGFAQSEGEIIYTTKIDMWAGLPDDENGAMIRQYMPQYQTMQSRLLFNATSSIYSNDMGESKNEPDLNNTEEDNVQIEIRMDNPLEIIYSDLETNTTIEQRDLMDKKFLIKDSIQASKWKITAESKEVSGYNCLKAFLINDQEDEIFAWFTPQIPVSTGPGGMGGLPGLIMYVSMDSGRYTIAADKIILRKIEKGEIVAPKKGKEITRAKFERLVEKKRKQQEKEYGGEGGIIIRTEER